MNTQDLFIKIYDKKKYPNDTDLIEPISDYIISYLLNYYTYEAFNKSPSLYLLLTCDPKFVRYETRTANSSLKFDIEIIKQIRTIEIARKKTSGSRINIIPETLYIIPIIIFAIDKEIEYQDKGYFTFYSNQPFVNYINVRYFDYTQRQSNNPDKFSWIDTLDKLKYKNMNEFLNEYFEDITCSMINKIKEPHPDYEKLRAWGDILIDNPLSTFKDILNKLHTKDYDFNKFDLTTYVGKMYSNDEFYIGGEIDKLQNLLKKLYYIVTKNLSEQSIHISFKVPITEENAKNYLEGILPFEAIWDNIEDSQGNFTDIFNELKKYIYEVMLTNQQKPTEKVDSQLISGFSIRDKGWDNGWDTEIYPEIRSVNNTFFGNSFNTSEYNSSGGESTLKFMLTKIYNNYIHNTDYIKIPNLDQNTIETWTKQFKEKTGITYFIHIKINDIRKYYFPTIGYAVPICLGKNTQDKEGRKGSLERLINSYNSTSPNIVETLK